MSTSRIHSWIQSIFTNQTIDGTNYIWDFGNGKGALHKIRKWIMVLEGEFNF
ncbi:MAG: hypothetical protein IPM92_09140 [Saprospiraceae bacterium]|nr:hypothetical protein [Saprospiraceae bacterium]